MHTLAIDIGGTKFTVGGFVDSHLELRQSFLTDRSGGPGAMVSEIERVVSTWRKARSFQPFRCGVGFGGPVDFGSQAVILSTHVPGWDCFPLVATLERLAGCPVVMDNDANVGALGEFEYGAGIGIASLFYLTLSTGIGGGIVIDGKIVHGADSFAGEIGHMNLDPSGPACLCGSNGCFERMCCGLWLERDYGRPASELLLDSSFVDEYVVLLARGLKAALMILNPHRIVIGGGLSKAGERLFAPLRRELGKQMTAWSKARREVVPAQLGDDSVLYGALALAESIQEN